ncbi:MAG: NADPH:quinone reductase [Rhodospirillales bacterium]|nr:NADPH:quinone reductase [Rhodospirillales bacterium]
MRAAVYSAFGPAADVLSVVELPTPEPGPGEVRVRLAASGVNPSDVKSRAVATRNAVYKRVIPHSDGAGTIDAVGDGVDKGRIGARVWVFNAQWKRADGTAAEYVCMPAEFAVALPSNVDFAVGACLGIPALTAWRAVTLNGGVARRTALVTGGAGGVGHYAIQMAKYEGARVFATVSSPEKAAIAREAGADATIDYRTEDVGARVRELTGGEGVDRVIELDIAGNAKSSLDALKPGGTLAVYGSNKPDFTLSFTPMIVKNVTAAFFIVYELSPAQRREGAAWVNSRLAMGQLKTRIAARFPLSEIAAAHLAVESGKAIGNVVLDV